MDVVARNIQNHFLKRHFKLATYLKNNPRNHSKHLKAEKTNKTTIALDNNQNKQKTNNNSNNNKDITSNDNEKGKTNKKNKFTSTTNLNDSDESYVSTSVSQASRIDDDSDLYCEKLKYSYNKCPCRMYSIQYDPDIERKMRKCILERSHMLVDKIKLSKLCPLKFPNDEYMPSTYGYGWNYGTKLKKIPISRFNISEYDPYILSNN